MKDILYVIHSEAQGAVNGVTIKLQMYFLADGKKCPDYGAFEQAVKTACMEYLFTKPELPDSFRWLDFWADIPDEICEKHGFRKLSTSMEKAVEADQSLIDRWERLKSLLNRRRDHLKTFLEQADISYDPNELWDRAYIEELLEEARKVRTPEDLVYWADFEDQYEEIPHK